MRTDLENILGVLVHIVLAVSWLCMFGFALWLFVLWIKLSKDAKVNGGILSKISPVFIFTPAVLSDEGRLERNKFLKVFYLFILLVIVSVGLLLFSASLPIMDFSN